MLVPTAPARLSRRALISLALTAVGSGALVLLLVARLMAAGSQASSGPAGALVGQPAPDFTIQVWSGGTMQRVHLADLKGKPVLVNFYASWCTDCQSEQPLLEAAWQKYQHTGVVFIGIAFRDKEADSRAFLQQYGITFPCGPDLGGTAATDYGVTGVPETVLVNREGIVVRHFVGPVDDGSLDRAVQALVQSQ
jgi:cytochrome c biogenesis protein CcmG/thiol:disulfide interchange protein DsbE